MDDINDAIDNVFNHPNVGPFIGKQLIQRMVKSNPTPAYIERIASVFNDNGAGIRGDMKAVIRAILTDPEARDCEWLEDPFHGMLKEPMVRYMQVLKGLNAYNESNRYYNYNITSIKLAGSKGGIHRPTFYSLPITKLFLNCLL